MHPSRLNYLAYNNAPKRAIVSREFRSDGTRYVLECGHTSHMAPHFDGSLDKDCKCFECGVEFVKTSPRWADEWKDEE